MHEPSAAAAASQQPASSQPAALAVAATEAFHLEELQRAAGELVARAEHRRLCVSLCVIVIFVCWCIYSNGWKCCLGNLALLMMPSVVIVSIERLGLVNGVTMDNFLDDPFSLFGVSSYTVLLELTIFDMEVRVYLFQLVFGILGVVYIKLQYDLYREVA